MGYPTSLDDAYPSAHRLSGGVVIQSAIRPTSRGMIRALRVGALPGDSRYSLWRHRKYGIDGQWDVAPRSAQSWDDGRSQVDPGGNFSAVPETGRRTRAAAID